METVQIVLDSKLLKAVGRAARRSKVNRSVLIRDALHSPCGEWKFGSSKNATARDVSQEFGMKS